MLVDWTFAELQKITNGSNSPINESIKIKGFSIDTRSLKQGDLFCALKGEHHDGHDFLLKAYENGASCFLLSDTNKNIPSLPFIKVDNVLKALERIAKNTRKRIDARFIAITGSVGKTGTKEMIKLALSRVGKTFANKGNFNNHIGVPLSMSNAPYDSDYCILELGMNRKGEIKKLSNLVSPEIGIITAIENSHLKGLKTLKNILEAKSEILDNIRKDGCFIYNADTNYSEELKQKAEKINIRTIISYGKNEKSDIQLLNKKKIKDKYLIEAKYFKKKISWKMPDLSDHWYINSLCILGIGRYCGLNISSLLDSLENFKLPSGRGNLVYVEKWLKKFYIIDDSYNSSPASLSASLDKFNKMKFTGNKIAVLGDMNELGENSEILHLNMKKKLEKTNINIIFTVGKYMKKLSQELPSSIRKMHFEDIYELEDELKKIVCTNDCLLFKGSHSTELYSVVKKISGVNHDL